MEIKVSFPGGQRVAATIGRHTVVTDQPVEDGGGDEAVSPWQLFLASLATCAGYFALAWCEARSIPTDQLALSQQMNFDPETKHLTGVVVKLTPPPGLSPSQLESLKRAVAHCKVKRAMEEAPSFEVRLS